MTLTDKVRRSLLFGVCLGSIVFQSGCQSGVMRNPFTVWAAEMGGVPSQWEPNITTLDEANR